MKKELVVIIFLLLISFPAVKTLLQSGGYTSHDLTHHVIRQISMDKLLSEGQFPPRFSGELNNGYGYPVFLFNYPLPALIGEVFHKLGLGFVDSVKAVLFTSMVLSVLGMYLFLKELLGSKMAAFLGAIFYLYAPIRFLNVYVSAAAGSALASGIIPFVFLSMVLITKGKKRGWGVLFGGLSLAGLILAHNVTTLIYAPVLLIFAWMLSRKVRDIRVVREFGLMFLLGLGLSCWFWLPALVEKQYIIFDQIYQDFYKDQFLSIWQLLRSPWGYGLSHPQVPEPGDMSYQLGLVHILVVLILMIVFWVFRGIMGEKSPVDSSSRVIGGSALILFFVSVFLMLKVSLPVWENLPFLSLVQFPQRFQSISVFAASIAVALLIKYLPLKKIIFLVLIVLVIYANRNHWKINEVFNPGENYYLNLKTTSSSYGEHLPKWGRAMSEVAGSKYQILRGEGKIQITEEKAHRVGAQVEAETPLTLRLNQFYFPGWEVKVDQKKVDFSYLNDGQSYGLIVFDIEKGKHQILAEFKNTPVRNIADVISLISVTFLILKIKKARF